MAAGRFIVGPYFPARNRDGVLQAGALLYVYENGTTTKATIYTDEGLSILSANPVVANASGQFPAVWGEAGTADVPVPYTVMVTEAGGASLGNPSTFDDFYPSLNWENANITLAEAAAVAAEGFADDAEASAIAADVSADLAAAALVDIEEIAAGSPDAPSIVNKANLNGGNITGANIAAFRTAIDAASTDSVTVNTADITSVQTRKPSRTMARIFASASSADPVRVLVLGDSLGAAKYLQLAGNFNGLAGGVGAASPNTAGSVTGAGTPAGGNTLAIASSSGVTSQTGQYSVWFNGLVYEFAAAGTALYQEGGGTPAWTTVHVDYIREPGAGSIQIEVGGVVVSTTSANGASSFERASYTQAYGTSTVRVNVTGAAVKIINVHVDRPSRRGLNAYNLAVGGMLLATALADPVAVSRLGQFMADFDPDIIFFEMDDNFGDAEGQAAWNTLADLMDANIPYCDKVIIASSPRAADNAGKIASRDFLRTDCYDRGQSYLFFDGYTIFGNYAQMTATFGANDGTHPPASAQSYAADMLWQTLGFSGFNTGYAPKAVNYVSGPSYLGRGTMWGDDPFLLSRGALRVDSDSSFGLDWRFEVSRSITITDLSENPTGWLFSASVATYFHQMPSGVRIGSQTGPGIYTGSGAPEGAQTAKIGSVYLRTGAAGLGTTAYLKGLDTTNLGWFAIPYIVSGTATLVAGTVTVSTSAILTGDKVWLSCNTPGGTQGFLSQGTIVNATSFVINSSNAADTSTVNWMIVR